MWLVISTVANYDLGYKVHVSTQCFCLEYVDLSVACCPN